MTDAEKILAAADRTIEEARAFANGQPNAGGGTIRDDDVAPLIQAIGLLVVFRRELAAEFGVE